ncbi:class I SAM-dependent methyltransferase [Carboxylicivirga litoralis]|uniref:class I SAM-dependent methyltransferase n=1 Tax=Carboxylicivirga litoralis TaxID=2816963 RepID=UPI0039673729
MYSRIKGLILNIIPKRILFHYEYSLRFFYYLFYAGRKFQCNICDRKLSNFVLIENDRLCPRCGSLQRTRRLWHVLNDGFINSDSKILDFSPSRSLYRLMKKNPNYLSSDLSGDFLSKVSFDITKIETENERFDLIICYHILEHVDNDIKAMEELFRVLKKGGSCLIQTPFKKGEIYEDETIKSPKQREIQFGQFDHVRIYSIEGLIKRLENVGFNVSPKHFTSDYENLHGFNKDETVLICEKPN